MPRKTSSDPDYNGGGPGLGGMTPPSNWSGHSPPSGGQASAQQAVAGHIAAASHPSISSAQRSKMKVGLAIKKRDEAQVVRDAGGSPETGTKTKDGMAASPRFGHRFAQKLLERNRRGLAVGEAALLANQVAGRRMSSMGGIRARQVNALEAEHGGLLQSTWGPKTRREARKILSAESAARRSRQASGGVLPLGSRTERLGRVNDALVARNAARAKRAAGDTPETGSKTRDDLASASGATTSPSGRARIKADLRGNRAEDLGMRWGNMTASSARRMGFRRIDDLEARYGRAGQRDWGADTRAMAQQLLDQERGIPSARQVEARAKIKRQNKINAALQRRDHDRSLRRIGGSPVTLAQTQAGIESLARRDVVPLSQWPTDARRGAKNIARGLRGKKVGDAARARRLAAGKPADLMDLSQDRRVQEVNALEAQHGSSRNPWGSETRRMARKKVSDESHADRMERARMQGAAAARGAAFRQRLAALGAIAAAPARGAPVAGGRRGTDPDSEFGNDMYRGGNRQRPKRALAVTSPVRGPEPRADGRRHAEESLRLPEGHEFQDIDDFPPKGFPAHLDEVTPKGGGERLPIDLNGVTFKQWRHENRSDYDPEHMKNFQDMTPGVRKTAAGKLFVQKIALPGKTGPEAVDSSRKSTNQEMIADRIFRILGVPAPRSQVYSLKTGLPVPHDYQWAPGEASTRLAEHLGKDATTMGGAPQAHRDAWEGHERRYAVAKALLDHGDDHYGNTMLDGKHMDVPWKVDNGSALKYDAFGGEKSAGSWGEVSPQGILFPQIYKMIGLGTVTPREAYRQMEGIAKIWRRHGGSIKELYKNDDDPKQAKIFSSRAESIVRAVDMFKGPNEFARAMRAHFRAYDTGGPTDPKDLIPKRKPKGSGLSTGGGSLTGSEFMARSFRWGMNV